MRKKFLVFLEISKTLNRHGIIPILYGSLGLSRIIKMNDVDDIDIIIPDNYLTNKFTEFKKIMGKIGYKQHFVFPHTFTKNKNSIDFEPKSELKKDMGIQPKNIKITEIDGIKFGELSQKHYLIVYSKVLKLREKKIAKIKYKIKKLKKAQKH